MTFSCFPECDPQEDHVHLDSDHPSAHSRRGSHRPRRCLEWEKVSLP